jgi:hypothetical protein
MFKFMTVIYAIYEDFGTNFGPHTNEMMYPYGTAFPYGAPHDYPSIYTDLKLGKRYLQSERRFLSSFPLIGN